MDDARSTGRAAHPQPLAAILTKHLEIISLSADCPSANLNEIIELIFFGFNSMMSWIILIGQSFERLPKYFLEFIVMIDCNAIKSVGIF
jgi:hypothetical protein